MLALVLAHGHELRTVEQDVRGHEHRVGEQSGGGAVRAPLGGLVLELRHAGGLTEAGQTGEHPREFGMLGDVGLHEQGGLLRVDPEGEELGGTADGAGTQFLRILVDGDGVQIRDEVERLELVLQVDPLLQRTQVVAQVIGVGGGLDTGQHTLLRGGSILLGGVLFTHGSHCSPGTGDGVQQMAHGGHEPLRECG